MHIALTGAFGYSGQYIARRLLDAGHTVLTLTNSPRRDHPLYSRIVSHPLSFADPGALARSLDGAQTLINTYWVRFDHADFSHAKAVANTLTLFNAAKSAGVARIVHVSITNPDINSDLPYFRGKAQLEAALASLGSSYCILRPTVLFGKEDILINNIAWSLRHLPLFAVFGDGSYRLQPIFVDDFAALAADQATRADNSIINAIGPETFTYRQLAQTIRAALHLRRPIVSLPPSLCYGACRAMGLLVRDVIVTRDEIAGLMRDLLYVTTPPTGTTKLSEWIAANATTLGRRYTSELARRVDTAHAYKSN